MIAPAYAMVLLEQVGPDVASEAAILAAVHGGASLP